MRIILFPTSFLLFVRQLVLFMYIREETNLFTKLRTLNFNGLPCPVEGGADLSLCSFALLVIMSWLSSSERAKFHNTKQQCSLTNKFSPKKKKKSYFHI